MDEQRDVREVNARMESEGRAEVTVSLTVLWQSKFAYLLDDAKRLRDAGHHEAAIVTAQTACEVFMAVLLSRALRDKVGDDAIAGYITGSLRNNYNPNSNNGSLKKLYEVLFGKSLRPKGDQLWSAFDEDVDRRNRIVHRGQFANEDDANESIKAVTAVIEHLLQNQP
jgi:hypothetical protein